MKFFEETWKTLQQQTKFSRGKFIMKIPKSFKKCLVIYKILQKFAVCQLGDVLTFGPKKSEKCCSYALNVTCLLKPEKRAFLDIPGKTAPNYPFFIGICSILPQMLCSGTYAIGGGLCHLCFFDVAGINLWSLVITSYCHQSLLARTLPHESWRC